MLLRDIRKNASLENRLKIISSIEHPIRSKMSAGSLTADGRPSRAPRDSPVRNSEQTGSRHRTRNLRQSSSVGMNMSVHEATIADVSSRALESSTTYGHWVKRVIAFVLDEFVIVPFVAVGYVLISQGTPGWVTFGITIVAYGMAIGFYNRCIRMGVTGQSWGKMVTGTRLISERTGEPLGVGNVIVREMCHSADFILVVGSLLPLIDARRQCLGDKIAGSVVVNVPRMRERADISPPH
jgi:uncharacterized RDD family membrane protein YckC